MIHIERQPEPDDFNSKVRTPGNLFLAHTPSPRGKDWSRHSYWTLCSSQLYSAYRGICAYTGEWFAMSSSPVSVDHFYPKSTHQELAYEWSNYRLTTQQMNSYKSDKIVSDPFEINDGDFTIDFPSCLIKPNTCLAPGLKNKILYSIKILHLNDEEFVNNRLDILLYYINGNIDRVFLESHYPFIGAELKRQNLFETIGERFKDLPPSNS